MVNLSQAQINHLRRLIGYIRCEVGPEPDEIVSMVKQLAPVIEPVSEEGKDELARWHAKSAAIPKYVRAAIKALEKVTQSGDHDIVDAEESRVKIHNIFS